VWIKKLRERPNFKTLTTVGGVALTLLVFLLANVIGNGLGGAAANRTVEGQLASEIEQWNMMLPMIAENGTRLEKLRLENHRVLFSYTIMGERGFGLAQRDISNEFLSVIQPVACKDPFAIKALHANIPMDYRWFRSDGQLIGTATLHPQGCGIKPRH